MAQHMWVSLLVSLLQRLFWGQSSQAHNKGHSVLLQHTHMCQTTCGSAQHTRGQVLNMQQHASVGGASMHDGMCKIRLGMLRPTSTTKPCEEAVLSP